MRSSDVFQTAVGRAATHPAVVERLGALVEPGWLISGRIHIENDRGDANLSIPLEGSQHDATLEVSAERRSRRWHYTNMRVVGEDASETDIDLLLSNERH
jgi:hypothetical protein